MRIARIRKAIIVGIVMQAGPYPECTAAADGSVAL
jgi:hypothetical protein